MSEHRPDPTRPSRWRRLPALVMLVLAILGFALLRDDLTLTALQRHRAALVALRDAHYAAAMVGFVLAYAALVALSLPGATVASLTGGFLFGLFPGTALNVIGASLGAMAVFSAVRAGFGPGLAARIEAQGGRVAALRAALAKNEWEMLFLMRVTPIVPFFAANLLPALLNIGFGKFAVTTVLGILPGALLLTSVGAGLEGVLATGGVSDPAELLGARVFWPVMALVALGVLPMLVRWLRGTR